MSMCVTRSIGKYIHILHADVIMLHKDQSETKISGLFGIYGFILLDVFQ